MNQIILLFINRLRIPLGVILVVLASISCRRGDESSNATLRLKMKGSLGETVWLEKVTLEDLVMTDSARVDEQGEATFSIKTEDFDFFLLKKGSSRPIMVAVEKNEQVEIYTSAARFGEEYEVRGSGASALLQELEKQKLHARSRLDSLGNVWHKMEYAPDKMEQKRVLDSLAGLFQTEYKGWLAGFIANYPESPASIIAVYQVLGPGGPVFSLKNDSSLFFGLGTTLSARYPNNIHVKDLVKRNEEYRKENADWWVREGLLTAGMDAPPVDLISTSGERVSLDAVKGNIVLLYFWDARKKECWDINLQLTEIYKLNSAKGFRIFGIYTGEDKQLLYNAIQIDRLPWTHLFATSAIVKTYNADQIPSLLLIGRDGKILSRSLTVQQLSTRLPQLLLQSGTTPQAIPENIPQ